MASTYGNDLRLEEIGNGEQSGSWGTTTNTNLELIAEALSFGTEAITTNADTHTTTIADGATDPGRSLYLKYTGTLDSACTITIAPNSISKTWYIENGTSGSQSIIISQGSGANVTIKNGQTKIVYSDGAGSGAAMAEIGTLAVANLAVDTNATIGGTLGVTGVLTGTSLDISGNVDIDGTTNLDAVDIDGAVQLDATLTVGANDQGYDVTLHGDTASRNMQWDSSIDCLKFTDAVKILLGDGNDLQIYHDGSNSFIDDNGSGNLNIRTINGAAISLISGSENMITAETDGAVTLYHNNAIKAATTATGISVSGSVVDNLTRGSIKVGNSSGVFAPLAAGTNGYFLKSDGTDLAWGEVPAGAGATSKVAEGSIAIRTAVNIESNGKVSQVQLTANGSAPVLKTNSTAITTQAGGASYYSFGPTSTGGDVFYAVQTQNVCNVATINSDGTVTTSPNRNCPNVPGTSDKYWQGWAGTRADTGVMGMITNYGVAYVRGVKIAGSAGSKTVSFPNTITANGGSSAGNWDLYSLETGYFCFAYNISNVQYFKFGSQDAAGNVALGAAQSFSGTVQNTRTCISTDYDTGKIVVVYEDASANLLCRTVTRSGTSASISAAVDSGFNVSGMSNMIMSQDGTSKRMVVSFEQTNDNATFGTRYYYAVINTSGSSPVWNNNTGNTPFDDPRKSSQSGSGFKTSSRPLYEDHFGARQLSYGGMSRYITDGTASGTSATFNAFGPDIGTNGFQGRHFSADGSSAVMFNFVSSIGNVRTLQFSNKDKVLGISSNAANANATVGVTTLAGISTGHSGLSVGQNYYANTSTGAMQLTPSASTDAVVGLSISATEILLTDGT